MYCPSMVHVWYMYGPCMVRVQYMYDLVDLLRASIIPPEKTTEYMASTPTVDETMGSRPTAAQPLNKALDAVFVRNRTKKNIKNLQTQSSITEVDSGSPYYY